MTKRGITEVVPQSLKRLGDIKSVCVDRDDHEKKEAHRQPVGIDNVSQDKLHSQFVMAEKDVQGKLPKQFVEIEEGLKYIYDSFFKTEKSEQKMFVEAECVTRLLCGIEGGEKLQENITKICENVNLMKERVDSNTSTDDEGGKEAKEEEENGRTTPPLTRLQVSYLFYNLESHLWNLLLCFSLFPEKAIINKRQIIYRWIGEGLVETSDPPRDLEEIAEDLFKELIHKGLIEPVKKRGAMYHNPVVKSCRMHPTIHQHVTAHAKQQGYFDFHSCLTKTNDNEGEPSRQSELKTLFNLDARYLKLGKRWFSGKENVRVLQLGRWQSCPKQHIEMTDNTGLLEDLKQKLKNLRYLSLKGVSDVIKLPDGVGDLVNLIILDLRACHNLESLTTRIALLKKLTHLDVSECYLLDNIPEELAQLSELQVLKGFILGQTQGAKRSCKLSDLGKLKKLRKLSINITPNVNAWLSQGEELRQLIYEYGAKRSCKLSDLGKLKKLRKLSINITPNVNAWLSQGEELRQLSSLCSLTITWARLPSLQNEEDLTMVSFPFPEKNLEKLNLRCLPTEHPPKWLEPNTLGGLKKLYIRGGQLKRLPFKPETTWVKLEVLRLKCLKKLEEDIDLSEPRKVFPKLIYLEVFQCDKVTTSSKDGVWGFGKAN